MELQKKIGLLLRKNFIWASHMGETLSLRLHQLRNLRFMNRSFLFGAVVIGLPVLVALFPNIQRTVTAPLLADFPSRIVGIVSAPVDNNRSDGGDVVLAFNDKQDNAGSTVPPPNVTTVRKQDVREESINLGNSGESDGLRNVEFNSDSSPKSYLPPSGSLGPDGRANIIASGSTSVGPGTTVTIPVSQGRLLRFDDLLDSVFVADPGIADIRMVSSDLIYVYGKAAGVTNLMVVSRNGGKNVNASGVPQKHTASVKLNVILDETPAKEAQKEWAPETPLKVTIFGRRTAVKGALNNIDEAVDAENLAETYSTKDQPPINKTTLSGSNQINIRVRFAEALRSGLRKFGIDWNVGVKNGNFLFGLEKSGDTEDANLALGVNAKDFNVEVLIEALQANGTLRILAEPNLTAVTGETASFLAGGEVPVPVPNFQNGNNIAVQYKPFGVSLNFTPTLVTGNRIAMRIKPEVSSIASLSNFAVQGFSLPAFTVRRAETTVEMASGQTFAIAGLFQSEVTTDIRKVPLLGDVPILRELFRSKRYQRNETELVILITPYLVRPVSDKSLTTPLEPANTSLLEPDYIGLNDSIKDKPARRSLR